MIRATLLSATCLALLSSQIQDAQGQMSLRDFRSLSKRRATSQARHDLDDTVKPKGEYPKGNYTAFVTRPYGTPFSGICARDILSLSYAYTHVNADADHGQGQTSDHVPVKPYSVSVKKEYAFVRTPDVDMLNATMYEGGSQFRSECTDMKADKTTWFSVWDDSNSPKSATEAWLLLMKAIEIAGNGTMRAINCRLQDESDQRKCLEKLASLGDYRLFDGVTVEIATDERRYFLSVGAYDVNIVIDGRDDAWQAIWSGKIRSVEIADAEIVVD